MELLFHSERKHCRPPCCLLLFRLDLYQPAEFVENKEVYGKNFGQSFMMWLCRRCDARVGVHKNNPEKPLGTMANNEVYKTKGKNNKRLNNPKKVREWSEPGAFTHSFTLIREPNETMAIFMERVEREKRDYIDNLNKNMYDTAGNANEAGEESYVSYSGATVSINQSGGGWMGMERAKPYNYEFQQYASIVDDGNCVPESLHKLYPKFSVERIMEEMGGEGAKTSEQVLEWCKQKDITCIGCDDKYNVLVEYYSKNRNRTPLYFVNKDNHFYLMDKSKGVSIANSRSNARKTETKKQEEKIEYEIVRTDDLNLIDFKATNKHKAKKE